MDNEKFRRLTCIKQATFDEMVGILEQSIKKERSIVLGKETYPGKFTHDDFEIH